MAPDETSGDADTIMMSGEEGTTGGDVVMMPESSSNSNNNNNNNNNCQDKYVLLLGENLFDPQFSVFSYETDIPAPMDQDLLNLPLYDAEDFLESDGLRTQIGSIQEQVLYLPSPTTTTTTTTPIITEDSLECLGRSVWTFEDGQVSDSYTCQGPLNGTIITGGGGAYECAQGYTDLVDITEDFYEGAGYIVWKIHTCTGCMM